MKPNKKQISQEHTDKEIETTKSFNISELVHKVNELTHKVHELPTPVSFPSPKIINQIQLQQNDLTTRYLHEKLKPLLINYAKSNPLEKQMLLSKQSINASYNHIDDIVPQVIKLLKDAGFTVTETFTQLVIAW